MKLIIKTTYDIDDATALALRNYAWGKSMNLEEAALALYNEGKIDARSSVKRTSEILSIDDEDSYSDYLCLIASFIGSNFCCNCHVADCPHLGHTDEEHFKGVAPSPKDIPSFFGSSDKLDDEDDEDDEDYDEEEDDYDDYEDSQYHVQQRRLQRQQEEFQDKQLTLQRQQIEAQKEVSRNAIRSQIATLEAQLNAIPIMSIFRNEDPAELRARDKQRISLQSQIRALEKQLRSIR